MLIKGAVDLFEKCREFYANPQFSQKIGYREEVDGTT